MVLLVGFVFGLGKQQSTYDMFVWVIEWPGNVSSVPLGPQMVFPQSDFGLVTIMEGPTTFRSSLLSYRMVRYRESSSSEWSDGLPTVRFGSVEVTNSPILSDVLLRVIGRSDIVNSVHLSSQMVSLQSDLVQLRSLTVRLRSDAFLRVIEGLDIVTSAPLSSQMVLWRSVSDLYGQLTVSLTPSCTERSI